VANEDAAQRVIAIHIAGEVERIFASGVRLTGMTHYLAGTVAEVIDRGNLMAQVRIQ
jgi:hypothetical protein